MQMTLKIRFLEAVSSGELGEVDDSGVIVSLKQFKSYFEDVKSDYVNSFLPAAVIEAGQKSATHTKFLFRVRKGVYRVHDDAMDVHNFEAQDVQNFNEQPPEVKQSIQTAQVQAPTPVQKTIPASVVEKPVVSLGVTKTSDDADFPEVDSSKVKSRKKPNLEKMPASQMNNKVEEAMMQYMTYRLN